MKNKGDIAALLASVFLLVYLILINFDGPFAIIMAMFTISPVILAWMAFSILKFGVYNGPDLNEREWGYQDFEPARDEEEDYDGLLK